MSGSVVTAGFMPLVDAGPLIVGRELGFARQEGLDLRLTRAPSWSALRDLVTMGQAQAAQMLAPIPIAAGLGIGGPVQFDVLSVLSVNGTVIGVSQPLASAMRDTGYAFDFADPFAAGHALMAAAPAPLRIGVPFPFSMQAELLHYWLAAFGPLVADAVSIHTVPPPLMAKALAAGEIDAFCVGEPWGSVSVENGVGALLLPGVRIWQFAPEKVLACRADWAEAEPDLAARLIRAIWRAGRWMDEPANHMTAAEILSRPQYLDVPAEVIERSLSGQMIISDRGDQRRVPNFQVFHRGAAQFPWRSQGAWIAAQLASRLGLDLPQAIAAGAGVMRSDLFRAALAQERAELPGASAKVEGTLTQAAPVASPRGQLYLEPDAFFDCRRFDLLPGQ